MLGKKCSLAPLKEELRKQGVSVRRPFTPKHVCQRKRVSLEQLVRRSSLALSETEPKNKYDTLEPAHKQRDINSPRKLADLTH